MALIYSGQEAGYNHRLKFSEKDPIVWKAPSEGALYKKLFALKTADEALWNAQWGARMIPVTNSAPDQVLSFVRQKGKNKVFAPMNFSDKSQSVTFKDADGTYTDYFYG